MRSKRAKRIHRYLGTLAAPAPLAPLAPLPTPPPESHDPELCFCSGGRAEDPIPPLLIDIRDPLSPLEESLLLNWFNFNQSARALYANEQVT